MRYLGDLSSSAVKVNEALTSSKSNFSLDLIIKINNELNELKSQTDQLLTAMGTSETIVEIAQKAKYSCDTIVPLMKAVRVHADALENVVADHLWPITKYRELLYIK